MLFKITLTKESGFSNGNTYEASFKNITVVCDISLYIHAKFYIIYPQ